MLSEQTFLKTNDGTQLHLEYREKGSPVWLIATHGIGEHLGRHRYLPDLFSHEFNVFQYDLRSHGRSSGDRSYVPDFDCFERDLKEIIEYLKRKYKMQRYILFGHSMGALITAQYIQNLGKNDLPPEMIILNAPPVGYTGALGNVIRFTSASLWESLSKVSLSVRMKGLVDLDALSHYQEVRLSYEADDLNCLSLHSNLVLGMVKTSKKVFSRPLRSPCPSFVSVGSQDHIVDVKALVDYFTLVDKSFKLQVFEGAYHEIHNEIDKYRKPYLEYLKSLLYEVRYQD